MKGLNQKIFLTFLVLSFLSGPSSLQAADFQRACVKAGVASDGFTGKVVGVSDGDIISVMRGGRAVKVRLHGIASMGEVATLWDESEAIHIRFGIWQGGHGLRQGYG